MVGAQEVMAYLEVKDDHEGDQDQRVQSHGRERASLQCDYMENDRRLQKYLDGAHTKLLRYALNVR